MKTIRVSMLFIVLLFLVACNNEVNSKEHLGEIYRVALGSIMEKDEALSNNIEYIAIDMSNFEELNEQDKKEILAYFEEKFSIEVMDATYEELQEKGLYNTDTKVLDGVLLRIEKVDFVSNEFVFDGSKYRAGDGAVGVKGIVHFKNGKWQIKESKETWKS